MNLDSTLYSEIQKAISDLFNDSVDRFQLQPTNPEFEGSHTLVCFPLTRLSKKSPEETAKLIGEYLVNHGDLVVRYNAVKGFLNLELHDSAWVETFQSVFEEKNFGTVPPTGQEIMVEYSSPNTNKPLHLGHLRNNFLGWSVSKIYEARGYKVHKVQIINDRGIHICKSMAAWKLFGNGETPQSSGLKGDKLVGKYYVLFEKKFREEIRSFIDELDSINPLREYLKNFFKANPNEEWFIFEYENAEAATLQGEITLQEDWDHEFFIISLKESLVKLFEEIPRLAQSNKKGASYIHKWMEPLFKKNSILVKAQEMLRLWEAKDPETVQLWETMNGWVYEGFDVTYHRMGVDFEKLYYESDTYLLGKDEVLRGLEQGVFFKKDDGSVWVDLSPDGLDQKVLLRADGTSVYMTQDIGTAILRFRDFPKISKQVYTVGNEQEYHFKVLFLILSKLGYTWARECYHLSYGMVDLPTGKMKSREGTVVDADDLMEEMIREAERQTQELGKIEEMSKEEANQLFETIGLGALKFFLLKVDPKKRMMFDPAESIQLQGHTGPFIQYTYARISSILRKVESSNHRAEVKNVSDLQPSEREIIQLLNRFPERLESAAKEYSPAIIANFAYELAKGYNQFYQAISIFGEVDGNKLQFRVALSKVVADTIKRSMDLLGINVPERM
jgi:arginyl-tRNA synthetase